jgi:hypothetical protein
MDDDLCFGKIIIQFVFVLQIAVAEHQYSCDSAYEEQSADLESGAYLFASFKLSAIGYYHGDIPCKTDAVGGDRGYKTKNYHEYLCSLCQSRGLTLLLCGGLVGLVALIALIILKILKILIILLILRWLLEGGFSAMSAEYSIVVYLLAAKCAKFHNISP